MRSAGTLVRGCRGYFHNCKNRKTEKTRKCKANKGHLNCAVITMQDLGKFPRLSKRLNLAP